MKNCFSKEFLLLLCIILIITPLYQTSAVPPANMEANREMEILELVWGKEGLVITPTRHQKDILQVAENITVITSEELELINAHTLTDALNNIPGVQILIFGGPGSFTNAFIQSSEFRYVLIMIDGVAMNNLSDNVVDIGAIPIQNIEKIEIIKGPASSSWGSSLGGIIHIITKSPSDSEKITGTYSTFYGEKNTTDYRAEASGRIGSAGYYFYAGNMSSDGLTEDIPYDEDNFYSKLNWHFGNNGRLLFALGHNKGSRSNIKMEAPLLFSGVRSNQDIFEYLFSTFSLEHPINDEVEIKLSFRSSSQDMDNSMYDIETGEKDPNLPHIIIEDSSYGGSIDITWTQGIHNILFGLDVDRGKLSSENVIGGKQYLEKWAVFSNNTIMLDRLSLTPGIRYDHTNRYGDYFSPSLGLTYMMTERNLFRGYIARGFHIPPIGSTFGDRQGYMANPDLKVEKIWSIQAGMESTALKYIWLKTTLFHHNIWDVIDDEFLYDPNGRVIGYTSYNNNSNQRLQGIELELKTVSVYNTSLFAGFTFTDVKNILTDTPVAKYTYDFGINYHNNKSLWAYLKGHYIHWDYICQDPEYDFLQDHILIWDINLIKEIHWDKRINIKTFFTVHNIFNGSPYQYTGLGRYLFKYEYPERWMEAGIKFNF